MELKELLKEARKQTGMTQKQFAAYFRRLGTRCSTYSRISSSIDDLSFGNGRFGKRTFRKNARLMLEVNTMPLQTDHLDIPIWQKYTMTIEEAAAYFHIGRSRIRAIVAENPYAPYVLMVGNRVQIKRKLFEQFVDEANAL